MSSSLLKYRRNNISDRDVRDTRNITAFYSYCGKQPSPAPYTSYTQFGRYILFVRDSGDSNKNIYIEIQSVSIIIPYDELHKYNNLYVYYIISLQLTPSNSQIYYSNIGYKGIYKELRYWYILTNICWKSLYMSFGDYCYFKENPLNINLTVCDTKDKIDNFMNLLNDYENPYKICEWLINYEINVIKKELYQNELIVKNEKMLYERLQIIKRHFCN